MLPTGNNASDGAISPEPIIDVHLHALLLEEADPPNEHFCLEYLTHAPAIDPIRQPLLPTLAEWRQDPDCPVVVAPAESDEANMLQTIQILRERNIIGIVGGSRDLVAKWHAAEPEPGSGDHGVDASGRAARPASAPRQRGSPHRRRSGSHRGGPVDGHHGWRRPGPGRRRSSKSSLNLRGAPRGIWKGCSFRIRRFPEPRQ